VAKILDSLAQLAYKDAIFDAKEDWFSFSEIKINLGVPFSFRTRSVENSPVAQLELEPE
jgi:hypothetical protein